MNFLFASFLCVLFSVIFLCHFSERFASKDRGFKAIQSAPYFYRSYEAVQSQFNPIFILLIHSTLSPKFFLILLQIQQF